MATLVFFGGFLGSGKTTLISKLINELKTEGKTSAVITNDQSPNLVDTSFIKEATQFGNETNTKEISDGCFCCRFQALLTEIKNIISLGKYDYIFAEAVGSCTDIRSTVALPLLEYHKYLDIKIAPLLIVFDGMRIENEYKSLDLLSPKTPKETLLSHQVKEAQILLISKKDKIKDMNFAQKYIKTLTSSENIFYSAGSNDDIKIIRAVIDRTIEIDKTFDIDYDIYAKAEAELGWYNGTWEIASDNEIDSEEYVSLLLETIAGENAKDIAHAKCYLAHENGGVKMSLVSGVMESDGVFENVKKATVICNIRAERTPDVIAKNVEEAHKKTKEKFGLIILSYKHTEIIPSYPKPFYHMEKK